MSTYIDDSMINSAPLIDFLKKLAFTEKEAQIYLMLLEIGNKPAASIAKKLNIPKSTVLFTCDQLVKRGYVRKSLKGKTQYYYARPEDLEQGKKQTLIEEERVLAKLIPLLREVKNPYSEQPSITFFEGVEGCQKAYLLLLQSQTEILEFGIHKDLTEKLGDKFMQKFIKERVKRKIFLRAISNSNDVDLKLQKRDRLECREQRFFSPSIGRTFSSIAIFDSNVLLLNLHSDAFGILVKNKEVSETLSTIFKALWHCL